MTKFIGRREELEALQMLRRKKAASFVVIRGRRRIGKSRLIAEFGQLVPLKLFSGVLPTGETTKQGQIDHFCSQMATNFGMPTMNPSSWHEVFWLLDKAIGDKPVLLALDEISWMGSKDPDFLGHLKNAWDMFFSKYDNLILVVCGSVSSWIEKNILSSSGFVGRISLDIQLGPLSLSEAAQFWSRRDRHEILQVLSVTGGVPRYLEEILPHLSADQNISRLCFDKAGLLYGEFDKIFSDLFSSRAPTYKKLVEALSGGSRTIEQLVEVTKITTRRASIASYLKDLEAAGFIAADPTWNLKSGFISGLKLYRLSDNYLRFYLRYILPNRARIARSDFAPAKLSKLSNWDGVMGLQFENLVLGNVHMLAPLLSLTPNDLVMYGPYLQRPTKRKEGCQIDLLIQTRYRTLYLCEVKFSQNPIGLGVGKEIVAKAKKLPVPRGWSVRLVLVHVNGVTSDLEQADMLDYIINYSDLVTSTS